MLDSILSNQKNTHTYTMMMQLKVVAVWVFLLVSTAGLIEGKWGPSTVTRVCLGADMLYCSSNLKLASQEVGALE